MTKKTDNYNLGAKLDLRRYLIDKHLAGQPLDVMDCCCGSGAIWKTLRTEYPIRSYLPLDLKPKKGRLKIDSSRVLSLKGWIQNVVDVDIYGAPWAHWFALLPNVTRPTLVFLTIGALGFMGCTENRALQSMGLEFKNVNLPNSFRRKLSGFCKNYCLAQAWNHGLRIEEAVQAVSEGSADYYGLFLVPDRESVTETPVQTEIARTKSMEGIETRNLRKIVYGRRDWKRAREAYLRFKPPCRICGKEATIVDHIIPHRGDEELFWDESNWQPLCKICHDQKTNKEVYERERK